MRTVLVIAAVCAACGSQDMLGLRIASFPEAVASLAVAPNKVYAQVHPLDVYEIGPLGGSRRLFSAALYPVLATTGNQIYFPVSTGSANVIAAYETTSAAQRTIVPVAGSVSELLADADRIYWVDFTTTADATVHSIATDGTGAVLLGPGDGIFQDELALYWTSGFQILRAAKSDLSSRISLASGFGIGAAAASNGTVYWSPRGTNQVLSMPADGSGSPTLVANLTVGSLLSAITAMWFFDGKLYLHTLDRHRGDCCVYTASIVELDHGAEVVVARAENVTAAPPLASGQSGIFWASGRNLYRVR